MTQIASITKTTSGLLNTTNWAGAVDPTTKYNYIGTPSWGLVGADIRVTPANASVVGSAAINPSGLASNQCVVGNIRGPQGLAGWIGFAARAGSTSCYVGCIQPCSGASLPHLRKVVASSPSLIASGGSGMTTLVGSYYPARLAVNGSSLSFMFSTTDYVTTYPINATDTAITQIGAAGLYAEGPSDFMNSFFNIHRHSSIFFNGLLDGMKAKLYYSATLVATSSASSGGVCTIDTLAVAPHPNFTKFEITDTDGTTVIYTETATIYYGDIWTASITQTPIRNPPCIEPLKTGLAKVYFMTKHGVCSGFVHAEIYPSSANRLGLFRITFPSETPNDIVNFGKNEPIWIGGKAGLGNCRLMRGIVERPQKIELSGGRFGVQLSGRSLGAYCDLHKASETTTYQNQEISAIVQALGVSVPELDFTKQIFNTGVTLTSWTMLRGRPIWDALKELAILASTPTTTWGVWDCIGSCSGEVGPTIHFAPIGTSVSSLPIAKVNTARFVSPEDSRQVITQTIVAYWTGTAVAYLTTTATGPGTKNSYVLSLDGSTNYVTIPHATSLQIGAG